VPGPTRTGNQAKANVRPVLVAGRTPAPVARPTYRAAPQAGRGRGLGKVARWPRGAALLDLAGRCHALALRVAQVARDQVLVLVPASAPALLEAPAARQAVPVLPACGQVAPDPLGALAPDRLLAAPTRPTVLPPRAVPLTAELQARVRRREVVAAQVVVPEEALVDAAAGAARAGVGARALTGKSYKPRRRRHMWRPMPPCRRAKSSSNGVPRPKSWRRA
jgi:hypothetical protein